MEIYYTIEKNSENYSIYKNVKSDKGMGFIGIFRGTRKECINYAKKNKIKIKNIIIK